MDIYIATNNPHKVQELKMMIDEAGLHVKVYSAQDLGGMPHVVEDGDTFEANAKLKAEALRKVAPEAAWVMADDSGLCVDELNGAPGVGSARYSGEHATDDENNKKLLIEMNDIPMNQRRGKYTCCLVVMHPSVKNIVFQSICKGTILDNSEGEYGFGYDPLFMPLGESKTFAEMSLESKNKISHRGRALKLFVEWLKKHVSIG